MQQPEDDERRYEFVTGLRHMAEFFEKNPEIPINFVGLGTFMSVERREDLDAIAAIIGAEPTIDTSGDLSVRASFGPHYVEYFVPRARLENPPPVAAPEQPTTTPDPDIFF